MRKFACIKAMGAHDCGPAALASVVRFHGGNTTIALVSSLANADLQGVELTDLACAAEALGFEANCGFVRADQTDRLPFPVVAHVRKPDDHYVVLYKISSEWATVADPARGLIKIRRPEFEQQWTRAALVLRPTARFIRGRHTFAAAQRFLGLCLRERRDLLAAIGCGLVATLATFAVSLVAKTVFDGLMPGAAPPCSHRSARSL